MAKKGLLGELDGLHHRMEKMMETVLQRHGHRNAGARTDWCPAVDLYETDTEVVVLLDVAGIDPKSLDVVLEDDMLRVVGARFEPSLRHACKALHHMEIEYGQFERLLAVPFDLDGDAARARLDNGFLEVRIPKRAADPPSNVEVTTS
ncbi:MAG: Hsp20/alpha crystallin family protein [Acidobacteriota bacterium]